MRYCGLEGRQPSLCICPRKSYKQQAVIERACLDIVCYRCSAVQWTEHFIAIMENNRVPLANITNNDARLAVSPSQARKRPRNSDNWANNTAKRKRNCGLEYTSPVTKKVVAARIIGPQCICKLNCISKIGRENIEQISSEFYESGSWDTQTAYIQKQTHEKDVKRHRTEDENKKRKCTRQYFVKIPGIVEEVRVCKQAFASIHGITKSRIDRAQDNKTPSNVPIKDRRGKYGHHNQLSKDKKLLVLKHIASFPTVTSHYSRKSCPHVKYFDATIQSKSELYELYKIWLEKNYNGEDAIPVTDSYYDNMFKTHFPNLKIYLPRKDTCRICDSHKIQMKDSTLPHDLKAQMINMHRVHLLKADTGYKLPNKLLELCKYMNK